jgi:hypothetical protein
LVLAGSLLIMMLLSTVVISVQAAAFPVPPLPAAGSSAETVKAYADVLNNYKFVSDMQIGRFT